MLEYWARSEALALYWVLYSEPQGQWSAEGGTIKFKMDGIRLKNHYSIIPLFHYSMIETNTQTLKNHPVVD